MATKTAKTATKTASKIKEAKPTTTKTVKKATITTPYSVQSLDGYTLVDGMKYKGRIFDIEVDGILTITKNDVAYILSNNSSLAGMHPRNMHGYKYAYGFNVGKRYMARPIFGNLELFERITDEKIIYNPYKLGMFNYSVRWSGGEFVFGCGEVRVTEATVQGFIDLIGFPENKGELNQKLADIKKVDSIDIAPLRRLGIIDEKMYNNMASVSRILYILNRRNLVLTIDDVKLMEGLIKYRKDSE